MVDPTKKKTLNRIYREKRSRRSESDQTKRKERERRIEGRVEIRKGALKNVWKKRNKTPAYFLKKTRETPVFLFVSRSNACNASFLPHGAIEVCVCIQSGLVYAIENHAFRLPS